jgi:hypothetical protein
MEIGRHAATVGLGFSRFVSLVIDPVETRRWIATLFRDLPPGWWAMSGKRRPNLDLW